MAGAGDLFGQFWKEYAMSDSRYLTSDAFVLCMETVTAVSIPLRYPDIGFALSTLTFCASFAGGPSPTSQHI